MLRDIVVTIVVSFAGGMITATLLFIVCCNAVVANHLLPEQFKDYSFDNYEPDARILSSSEYKTLLLKDGDDTDQDDDTPAPSHMHYDAVHLPANYRDGDDGMGGLLIDVDDDDSDVDFTLVDSSDYVRNTRTCEDYGHMATQYVEESDHGF